MKAKKLLLASLCAAMAVSAVGCEKGKQTVKEGDYSEYGYHESGYPIVDKPLTLKVVARKNPLHGDWDQTYWGEYAQEKTGIKMEFEYIDKSAWEQKSSLCLRQMSFPTYLWADTAV